MSINDVAAGDFAADLVRPSDQLRLASNLIKALLLVKAEQRSQLDARAVQIEALQQEVERLKGAIADMELQARVDAEIASMRNV